MSIYSRDQVICALDRAEILMEGYLRERGWKTAGEYTFGYRDEWRDLTGVWKGYLEAAFWRQALEEEEKEVSGE